MKPILKLASVAWLASAALFTLAGVWSPAASAQEAVIRKNLSSRLSDLAEIDEVRKTPMAGIWEVRSGTDLYYTDAQGNYLIQGELIDTKAQRNLSAERIAEVTAIDFSKLPLADAFTMVRGNGERQLAVFEDPNCGYCKRFEKSLLKVNNITVHVFLYPILGEDSVEKARRLWCSKDKAAAWNDWMQSQKPTAAPLAACDTSALARNIAFGKKYKINGTPTLFFADGSRIPGAIPPETIEKQLTLASAKK
jgi:thiol:disulfide interchange protein DsbC